jgi:uncharacterized protein (DUF2147 family)
MFLYLIIIDLHGKTSFMKLKCIVLLYAFVCSSLFLFAQNKATDVIGVWLTPGDNAAKVEVYKVGDKFNGKVVWMKNPNINGKPKLDSNNPDINKRNIPRLGLEIMKGFVFNGSDEWDKGNIYDPQNGKTYSGYMYMTDRNTLKLRGYVGISLLGRTQTWTRVN